MIEKEKPVPNKYSKSDSIYQGNYSFTSIFVIKTNWQPSFKSKHSFLVQLLNDSNKFNKLKPQKEETKKKKLNVYEQASELYNDSLGIYLMNTMNYQMFKEKNRAQIWSYRFICWNIIRIASLEVKNRVIQQEKVLKKNL